MRYYYVPRANFRLVLFDDVWQGEPFLSVGTSPGLDLHAAYFHAPAEGASPEGVGGSPPDPPPTMRGDPGGGTPGPLWVGSGRTPSPGLKKKPAHKPFKQTHWLSRGQRIRSGTGTLQGVQYSTGTKKVVPPPSGTMISWPWARIRPPAIGGFGGPQGGHTHRGPIRKSCPRGGGGRCSENVIISFTIEFYSAGWMTSFVQWVLWQGSAHATWLFKCSDIEGFLFIHFCFDFWCKRLCVVIFCSQRVGFEQISKTRFFSKPEFVAVDKLVPTRWSLWIMFWDVGYELPIYFSVG